MSISSAPRGNFDPRQRMPWLLMADEVLGGRQNYDSIALHVITSRRQVRKHALEDQPHFTHYADRDKIIKRFVFWLTGSP